MFAAAPYPGHQIHTQQIEKESVKRNNSNTLLIKVWTLKEIVMYYVKYDIVYII